MGARSGLPDDGDVRVRLHHRHQRGADRSPPFTKQAASARSSPTYVPPCWRKNSRPISCGCAMLSPTRCSYSSARATTTASSSAKIPRTRARRRRDQDHRHRRAARRRRARRHRRCSDRDGERLQLHRHLADGRDQGTSSRSFADSDRREAAAELRGVSRPTTRSTRFACGRAGQGGPSIPDQHDGDRARACSSPARAVPS